MADWTNVLKKKGAVFEYETADKKVNSKFIKELRKKLGMSQRLFSAVLGISTKTVEKWEQEANPCQGTSSRLIYLIDKHPELVDELCDYKNLDTNQKIQYKKIALDSDVEIDNSMPSWPNGSFETNLIGNSSFQSENSEENWSDFYLNSNHLNHREWGNLSA